MRYNQHGEREGEDGRDEIDKSLLFRLELQRIKFMVNSYLRIRLEKIQKNIFYYASQHEDNPERLTSKAS